MPKSVLIILAAVVVLIAVVWYLGMRYLRSDDEEEFGDVAAEQGTTRGRGGHVPARGRREHDDFDGGLDLPRAAARSDAHRDPRPRPEADPRREQRRGRGDYAGDDRTELVPAGGRAHRSQPAGSRGPAGGDTSTGRSRPAARDFDRDVRDVDRDTMHSRDGRGTRTAPAVRELAVTETDAPDRRGKAKPAARGQRDDVLPAVKPRQSKGKSKRDDDGDWPSNEWDELSDVDYWTELASDKPFEGDAPAKPRRGRPDRSTSRTAARDHSAVGENGVGRNNASRDSASRDSASRDSVGRNNASRDSGSFRRPGRSSDQDVTRRLDQPLLPAAGRDRGTDWAARDRNDELTSTAPRRPDTARIDTGGWTDPGRSRHSAGLDDDPLTSPSFPRIAASDSRSYRRSRSGTHERPAVGSDYAAAPVGYDQQTNGYARPAAETYREYSAQPAAQSSAPGGYSYPGGGNGYVPSVPSVPAAYQVPAADPGAYLPPGGYERSLPSQPGGPSGYDAAPGYGGGSQPAGQYGNGHAGYDSGQFGEPDPLGYAGYGTRGRSGSHAKPSPAYPDPLADYPGPDHQADAGYRPAVQGEPSYPYQPGVPEPYTTPAAPTAPYLYQPAPAQPGQPGSPSGYAGADPYAADPYGYSGYGNTNY